MNMSIVKISTSPNLTTRKSNQAPIKKPKVSSASEEKLNKKNLQSINDKRFISKITAHIHRLISEKNHSLEIDFGKLYEEPIVNTTLNSSDLNLKAICKSEDDTLNNIYTEIEKQTIEACTKTLATLEESINNTAAALLYSNPQDPNAQEEAHSLIDTLNDNIDTLSKHKNRTEYNNTKITSQFTNQELKETFAKRDQLITELSHKILLLESALDDSNTLFTLNSHQMEEMKAAEEEFDAGGQYYVHLKRTIGMHKREISDLIKDRKPIKHYIQKTKESLSKDRKNIKNIEELETIFTSEFVQQVIAERDQFINMLSQALTRFDSIDSH